MKKRLFKLLSIATLTLGPAIGTVNAAETAQYIPAEENLQLRRQFADDGFGIFLHWGIYSMFGQGEWYLNNNLNAEEYAKSARGFYPAHFDADEWVKTFKDAGAKYVCITSRHHDGFSMWHTAQSPFNIVDGTPFKRDIIKEIADACKHHGLRLHLYYSHLDWSRDDYPIGGSGTQTGRDTSKGDWKSYSTFMNNQLTELLTNYGPIGAIWFDGMWDHDGDSIPFDWQLGEQYALIHRLQPACMIGNNHHRTPFEGEDFQIFEKDLPGQHTTGFNNGQTISSLPLETCETLNNTWGYSVSDQNYKSTTDLIHYLVKTAGMGANLLLNVGPQPSGELPATAVERLKEVGQWLNTYGDTFYATEEGDFPAQEWGTSTRKGDKLFIHIFDPSVTEVTLPALDCKIKSAETFDGRSKVKYTKNGDGTITLHTGPIPDGCPDYIIELKTTV